MPEYYQTCICCDDPIEIHGFHLHVCESCRREMGDRAGAQEQIITCCLYQAELLETESTLGKH